MFPFTTIPVHHQRLGINPYRRERSRTGYIEKQICSSVSVEALALLRVLKRDWSIRSVLSWSKRTQCLYPPRQICGLSQEAGVALGKAAVFSMVSPAGRWQYKCNSHCVISLLTSFFPTASFYGESYVRLNIIDVSSELSLQLKFQTSKPQGLLFLAAGEKDYCIIELLSGNLRVRFFLIFKNVQWFNYWREKQWEKENKTRDYCYFTRIKSDATCKRWDLPPMLRACLKYSNAKHFNFNM